MSFTIQFLSVIFFVILNIISYILTFTNDFALKNKDIYSIISIFNDFIFIGCFLTAVSCFRKAKFKSTLIFLSAPLIYTGILFLFFR